MFTDILILAARSLNLIYRSVKGEGSAGRSDAPANLVNQVLQYSALFYFTAWMSSDPVGFVYSVFMNDLSCMCSFPVEVQLDRPLISVFVSIMVIAGGGVCWLGPLVGSVLFQ